MDQTLQEQLSLRDRIISLKRQVERDHGSDLWSRFLDDGQMDLRGFEYSGIAYEPEVKICSLGEVDRLASMFAGPLFSSVDHPWPINDGGDLAAPIVQIRLDSIPALSGESLGVGLLQAWILSGFHDYFLRVVPQVDLRHENLNPMPNFSEAKILRLSGDYEMSWLSDGVAQIVGYGEPFFSCASNDVVAARDAPKEVQEIATLFKNVRIDTRSSQLFGTFSLRQFDHGSIGESMLLSMANGVNGVEGFGFDGTGQIFYRRSGSNGELQFFMDSSC